MFDISPADIFINIPGILLGISIHSYAQASCAYRLGHEQFNKYRRNISPASHIDILGLILFIFFGYGWPQKINISLQGLNNDRKKVISAYLAGQMSNFAVSLFFTLITKLLYIFNILHHFPINIQIGIIKIFEAVILTNLSLFLFTLLPLYPLTGYFIFYQIIPNLYGKLKFYRFQKFSRLLLAIIIISPLSKLIFDPVIESIYKGLIYLFKLYNIIL